MYGIGQVGASKLIRQFGALEKIAENKELLTGKRVTHAFENYMNEGLLSKKLVALKTDLNLKCTPESSEFCLKLTDKMKSFLTDIGLDSHLMEFKSIMAVPVIDQEDMDELSEAFSDMFGEYSK
jgi:DNA polymerase I